MSGHPCPERLLLPEALSGRLDPAEEKRVMAHLQTCATCQDAATDIEISLIALAVLRDEEAVPLRATPGPGAAPIGVAASDGPPAGTAVILPWRRRLPTLAAAAAAAIVFAAGGVFIGHNMLAPRDRLDFGPAVALRPPPGAVDTGARGSVAIATEKDALAVRLNATSLPTSGWYECIWVEAGQSRSAGSFRATNGVAKDVELHVAEPDDSTGWDLQLVHHQGDSTEVVLEGDVAYG